MEKMSGHSRYYVAGYGHHCTQVREVDGRLRQAMTAIERLATAAEARQMMQQAGSRRDWPSIADRPPKRSTVHCTEPRFTARPV
jgi:hypothetical protein